jgi:RNA polymerase sigma factor (sigma-70 family)
MDKKFDEKELVDKILKGSESAFGELIERYQALVLHIVTPIVGISEDREDICQDVFFNVYLKLNNFAFRSKLGTWIGNIAYNRAINFKSKKKFLLFDDLSSTEESPSGQFESEESDAHFFIAQTETIAELNKCIDSLTAMQRTVIVLFYKDELSILEICQIVELPENTVKSHLHRAKANLREKLKKRNNYE